MLEEGVSEGEIKTQRARRLCHVQCDAWNGRRTGEDFTRFWGGRPTNKV